MMATAASRSSYGRVKVDARDNDRQGTSIFRPPLTPGSASSSIYHAGESTQKRTRSTYSAERRYEQTSTRTPNPPMRSTSYATSPLGDFASPAPLANEQYRVAGGFDTPTFAAAGKSNYFGGAADRTNYRAGPLLAEASPSYPDLNGVLAAERNGVGRPTYQPTSPTGGWKSYALEIVGAVATKMFDFCANTVFRGFHAGGGQGYSLGDTTPRPFDHGAVYPYPRSASPLPGRFPQDDFLSDFEQDNSPLRPAKRRQISSHNSSSWVLVDHDLGTRDDDMQRLSTRKTSANLAATGTLSPSSASKASSRRSLIPVSRRPSSQRVPSISPSAAPARLPTPSTSPRRASLAPTRSPVHRQSPHARAKSRSSIPNLQTESRRNSSAVNGNGNDSGGLSPEAQKYVNRQARKERDADRSVKKLSLQVQDLIRQGQQALGTKFSVETENDDYGEDEGEYDVVDEGFESGSAGGWEGTWRGGRKF